MEPTQDKLNAMKLFGMAKYLRQWMELPKEKALTPAELLGLRWLRAKTLGIPAVEAS